MPIRKVTHAEDWSKCIEPGADAEYGRTQERCTILEIDRNRALVRFDDQREEWVSKKMLAWAPSEAEIAVRAEAIKLTNIAAGQMRPDDSEREGRRVIKGPGSFRKSTN